MVYAYRLDRAKNGTTPSNITSAIFLSSLYKDACAVYAVVEGGFDERANPNPEYGIMFSKWSENEGKYVPMHWKAH